MHLDAETLDTLCAHIAGIERLVPVRFPAIRQELSDIHAELRGSRGDISDTTFDAIANQLASARRALLRDAPDPNLAMAASEVYDALRRLRAGHASAGVREKLAETDRIADRTLSRFTPGGSR